MRAERSAEAWSTQLSAQLSARWAASGAAGLSGRSDGPPLDVPLALVRTAAEAADTIAHHAAWFGAEVDVDGPALLGERAAIADLGRRGSTSCGGGTRLLLTSDGWIALSLAREADFEAVPAWLCSDEPALAADAGDVVWPAIEALVAGRSAHELVERAVLLGMPVARLGEARSLPAPATTMRRVGPAEPLMSLAGRVVVDLSSLWAGPLCGQLLGAVGMRVIKVESEHRPDGARHGPQEFFDLLHGGHESVCLDLRRPEEQLVLVEMLKKADVVIEASRPRALLQWGIVAPVPGPRVWVSITGYGRNGTAGDRVGFGDDAAVAAGLVTGDRDDAPYFCADAVADPLTGMVAAGLVLERLASGGRWLLDLSLAATAAQAAGGPKTRIAGHVIAPPRARPVRCAAPTLGEHTASVLADLDIER